MSVQVPGGAGRNQPQRLPTDPRRGSGSAPPPNPPSLHRMLGAGLVVLAVVFLAITRLGSSPLRPVDGFTPFIVYATSGVAIALMAVAFMVFKPRVPARGGGQPIAEYWALPDVGGAVVLVWFLLEGAGVIATVGYALTGQIVSALVMGVTIVTYWLCGPSQFTNA
jgi:hypothetical protein